MSSTKAVVFSGDGKYNPSPEQTEIKQASISAETIAMGQLLNDPESVFVDELTMRSAIEAANYNGPTP